MVILPSLLVVYCVGRRKTTKPINHLQESSSRHQYDHGETRRRHGVRRRRRVWIRRRRRGGSASGGGRVIPTNVGRVQSIAGAYRRYGQEGWIFIGTIPQGRDCTLDFGTKTKFRSIGGTGTFGTITGLSQSPSFRNQQGLAVVIDTIGHGVIISRSGRFGQDVKVGIQTKGNIQQTMETVLVRFL